MALTNGLTNRQWEILAGISAEKTPSELGITDAEREFYDKNKADFDMIYELSGGKTKVQFVPMRDE